MRLAVELELGEGSGSVKMPYWFCPASQEPTRAGIATLLLSLTSFCGSMPFMPQRLFEEQERRAARAEAEDCLPWACFHSNLSTFSRPISMKPSVEVSPQKMRILVEEFAVEHVDRGLGSDQRDVGGVGKKRRGRLVAAERGGHRDVEAGVLEVALGDGDVGRRVEQRAHHLVVADLHRRLGLRASTTGAETASEPTAASPPFTTRRRSIMAGPHRFLARHEHACASTLGAKR